MVLPIHMGVILLVTLRIMMKKCTPHTHGGDSYFIDVSSYQSEYSPYTWG